MDTTSELISLLGSSSLQLSLIKCFSTMKVIATLSILVEILALLVYTFYGSKDLSKY